MKRFEKDRRVRRRIAFSDPVPIDLGTEQLECQASDLSRTGISLVCSKPVQVGRFFRALFSFQLGSQKTMLSAIVVWAKELTRGFRLGAQFDLSDHQAAATLDAFVASRQPDQQVPLGGRARTRKEYIPAQPTNVRAVGGKQPRGKVRVESADRNELQDLVRAALDSMD